MSAIQQVKFSKTYFQEFR